MSNKNKVVINHTQALQLHQVLQLPNLSKFKISHTLAGGIYLKAKAGKTLLRGKGNTFNDALANLQFNVGNTMYF